MKILVKSENKENFQLRINLTKKLKYLENVKHLVKSADLKAVASLKELVTDPNFQKMLVELVKIF